MGAPSSRPSFSRRRQWSITANVIIMTLAVLAFIAGLNYLSAKVFRRWQLSSQTGVQLSSRTLSVARSLTNEVRVTVYCSREEQFFDDIAGLLKEYQSANPKINVRFLDFERNPGAAEEFKIQYKLVGSTNRNLIVFDYEGRVKMVSGDAIAQNQLVIEQSQETGEKGIRKKPVAFLGELWFTSALIAVGSPKPLKAYFLLGHGEHSPEQADKRGYASFAEVLRQNYIEVESLSLLGTNQVPDDCNLLIIAGPETLIPAIELERIDKYLKEGGRLLALFNVLSVQRVIGLESILTKWGVKVTDGIVKDPDLSSPPEGLDVQAINFRVKHPLVNSLVGSRVQFILPREINALELSAPQTDSGLTAEEIVFSGPNSILSNGGMMQRPGIRPLVVAVEKSPARGVAAERGTTRIVVGGDSLLFANERIESAANRDFAGNLANWLLERPVLLDGVTPRPISEYRLLISKIQLRTVQWILLAAIPGGVLALGGLVWLRRRK